MTTMSIKRLGILAILGTLALSGCAAQTTATDAADKSAQATAPALRQYEPVANEDEALAALSNEQFTNYYDIICNKSSFRDFSEIKKSRTETPQEKEDNYVYINDAPDVVRHISDQNKGQVSSDSSVEKPQPTRCQLHQST
ncbi:hypothetical protein [Rothia nasimurium]|uniref:hypothetical protein n=1 Tax=Rothia nasimurium TaxID=85336 RepID=UPI001F43A43A|nr:hypothetical protein [Rothia nasimurium]